MPIRRRSSCHFVPVFGSQPWNTTLIAPNTILSPFFVSMPLLTGQITVTFCLPDSGNATATIVRKRMREAREINYTPIAQGKYMRLAPLVCVALDCGPVNAANYEQW